MALYHTHRPQRFDAVIGQEHIITTITNQITQNNIAHAYLFAGPRGVGKTTTARLIAKAINVPHDEKTGEPDNNHPDAVAIAAGKSIDVIEIDAASHTGVDHVREHIIENAQFKPTTLKYKVFIIDEVHMLSTSAFNALLKTLEEPPAHVVFILATTELHKLPATIISRCQRYTFRKVGQSRIVSHLQSIAKEEGVTIDETVLARIAHKSDGCVRDAVSLLEQVLSLGKKTITAEDVATILPSLGAEEAFVFLEQLVGGDESACMIQLQTLVDQGTNMAYFMDEVIDVTRLLMISCVGSLPKDVDPSLADKLAALQSQSSASKSLHMLDVLLKYRRLLRQSPIAQLPLEMAVIDLLAGMDRSTISSTPTPATTPAMSADRQAPVQKKTVTPPPAETQEPASVEVVAEKSVPPAEAVAEEPPASTPQASGNITKGVVQKKWKQFISEMESRSPALLFILKMTEVQEVNGATIMLSVEHGFHKDKLLDTNCKMKVESALEAALGERMVIDVIVQKKDAANTEIGELAAAFGGSVV